MDVDDFATKNTHGLASHVGQIYEANRESNHQLASTYGLGKNPLANTIHSSFKIQEKDARRRLSMDEHDKSRDWLGVLQNSSVHNGKCSH